MRAFSRPIQVYIAAVVVGGAVGLLASLPLRVETSELVILATLAASAILAGMYPLPLVHRHGRVNLTGGILLTAVFLASPSVACLLAAVVGAVSGLALQRRLWIVLFAVGANVLSVGLAAVLYHELADPNLLPLDSWRNVLALYLSATAYWIAISGLTTILAAARNAEPFMRSYLNGWREVYLQSILLTLLAVLATAAWRQGAAYAVLLLVPATAVYQWLNVTRLRQEQVIHAIEVIAEVLDRRHPFTFQHSDRVAMHAMAIGEQMGLGGHDLEVLRRAALIHDIGKMGVEDPWNELHPATRSLTEYQFYSLKQHAQLGAMIAREIPAFEEAEESIRYHHDWYDEEHTSTTHLGAGIPLGARIIAVADSYDRLCMANGEATQAYDPLAVEQLRSMSGRQLDPEILSCFLAILKSEQAGQPAVAHAKPAVG